jgi:hypothetical protein
MTWRTHISRIAALTLLLLAPSSAHAQAYCALRDPVQTVYQLYPTATSYRSIVATVGDDARAGISARFGLPMHQGELGRHTLYIALERGTPVGLVHVRSERTQWGLAEVAWALDFDLRVIDFRIQRSRSTNRAVVESDAFRATIQGKTGAGLAAMVAPGGADLTTRDARMSNADRMLTVAVLTSGVKAIAASEAVWGNQIRRFKTAATRSPR